jgi:tetratricopeptide (TPR) repeat protein
MLDNAKDADQVKLLIPPPSCLVLITSRTRFTLPGLAAKSLTTLSPDDSEALLHRIAPRIGGDDTANLAKLCGYLPLALRAVGSALSVRIDLAPAEYAQKLTHTRERLKLTEVDAYLNMSYELLPPEVQRQFRALPVFPGIFTSDAAAAVWKIENEVAREVLGQLLLLSLLEFDATGPLYRLHDLVRFFADTRLGAEDRSDAQASHSAHYSGILHLADDIYQKGGESAKHGLFVLDLESGNVQAGHAWAAANAHRDNTALHLCAVYPLVGAHCLALRLHARDRIVWGEAGLVAAQQLQDRQAEEANLGNLAVAHISLGDYGKAIEYSEQHLKIARETGDRRSEGGALCNLGISYSSLSEYRRAIEYDKQALQIAREVGNSHAEGQILAGC